MNESKHEELNKTNINRMITIKDFKNYKICFEYNTKRRKVKTE